MDRGYYQGQISTDETPTLEEPVVPIKDLGMTVPETNPATGANLVQNVEGAVRSGANTIQLVLTTSSQAVIGGRPKAYGKEVREALREKLKANEVKLVGIEMPTGSISNLSGFDGQKFNKQKLHDDRQEVMDAIRFAADVAQGGGVDIVSMEFPRTIYDQNWNKKTDKGFYEFRAYEGEESSGTKYLVDTRDGSMVQEIKVDKKVPVPEWKRHKGKEQTDANGHLLKEGDYTDYIGNWVPETDRVPDFDPVKNEFKVKEEGYEFFKQEAERKNAQKQKELGRELNDNQKVTPEEEFFKATVDSRMRIARGLSKQYITRFQDSVEKLKRLEKSKRLYDEIEKGASEEEKMLMRKRAESEFGGLVPPAPGKLPSEALSEAISQLKNDLEYIREQSTGQELELKQYERYQQNTISADKYAKQQSIQSYAELGIHAMAETRNNKNVLTNNPLYVGPELGWPGTWGGHPEEFIELVQSSRKKMIELLTKKEINEQKNPYYNEEFANNQKKAEEAAHKHIKGLFDTAHLGMWLNHFRRIPGESEDDRTKEFKKWYLEQTKKLAESDVVGAIQAVDSASGAHGHLPPGQGIFPVVDAVKIFKEKGFDGFIVSEGHEEEKFGQNRILLKSWEAFGSPIGPKHFPGLGYGAPFPGRWGDVQNSYVGRTYNPLFIVGAYAPSNDWKLWSEVQLE